MTLIFGVPDDDTDHSVAVGLCGACMHYFEDQPGYCEAFYDGDGIPLAIQTGVVDHRNAVDGDHDVQFWPKPPYKNFFDSMKVWTPDLVKEAVGHEFHGNQWPGGGVHFNDPEEAHAWAMEHFDPLNATTKEEQALFEYKNAFDEGMTNRMLRNEGVVDARAKVLDSVIAKNTIPANVTVYRSLTTNTDLSRLGINVSGTADQPKLEVGGTITDKGFLSTSLSKDWVEGYGAKNDMLEMQVPAGTHGVYMDDPKVGWTGFEREAEILLPRNGTMEITGSRPREGGYGTIYTARWKGTTG